MRVGDADARIGPRPERRPAFAERQISEIEDESLAVGANGKRGGTTISTKRLEIQQTGQPSVF
jgi:hypothetical protein